MLFSNYLLVYISFISRSNLKADGSFNGKKKNHIDAQNVDGFFIHMAEVFVPLEFYNT